MGINGVSIIPTSCNILRLPKLTCTHNCSHMHAHACTCTHTHTHTHQSVSNMMDSISTKYSKKATKEVPIYVDLQMASSWFIWQCVHLWSNYKNILMSSIVIRPIKQHKCSNINLFISYFLYTGCPRRNVPDFGRVFLMLKYTDITQNTYVQSWTVTEIMARQVWNFDSCYTLVDYQIHTKTGRNMWFL